MTDPAPADDETALRQAVIDQCRWMNAAGLNQGSSGNISVRWGAGMLITPSAIPYDAMTPDMLAWMALDDGMPDAAPGGRAEGAWVGPCKPSTEWRFHRDILAARPEIGAVVHTHAPHCTALAMTRRGIPAAHYMVALFGGGDIRCADYATFGTAALSQAVLAALAGRTACLMANHGMLALGDTLPRAMARAVELEALARQYCLALSLGGVVALSDVQIAEAAAAMTGYGASA